MRPMETPKSAAIGFRAGKYMLAVIGEMIPPIAVIITINLLVCLVKTEYGGPDGTLARASGSELTSLEVVSASGAVFSLFESGSTESVV